MVTQDPGAHCPGLCQTKHNQGGTSRVQSAPSAERAALPLSRCLLSLETQDGTPRGTAGTTSDRLSEDTKALRPSHVAAPPAFFPNDKNKGNRQRDRQMG